MSFPDDTLAPEDRCEICGAELGDEIVIQEFADGSLARLCPECAAGAALEALESYQPAAEALDDDTATSESSFVFPEPEEEPLTGAGDDGEGPETAPEEETTPAVAAEDFAFSRSPAGTTPSGQPVEPVTSDPLDKTRELLNPVVDLITLQQEMQAALQRLAASLEVFATDVISEKLEKAATVESRVESLERELELTRARLRETEALLAAATAGKVPPTQVPAAQVPAAQVPTRQEFSLPPVDSTVPEFTTPAPPPSLLPLEVEPTREAMQPSAAESPAWGVEDTEESTAEVTSEALLGPATAAAPLAAGGDVAAGEAAVPFPATPFPATVDLAAQPTLAQPGPPRTVPLVPPPAAAAPRHHLEYHAFDLAEVQIAQRYYNESSFTGRIRDVRRSLGKPRANLTKLPGPVPKALLTITWDIIWYQYLIDLRRDVPSDQRIVLHREGLDLDELASIFKEKNASIDDEGRLDASELEVKLLSDPTVLLTEMTPEEERALEDATEEIWDQRTAPEFKWDD